MGKIQFEFSTRSKVIYVPQCAKEVELKILYTMSVLKIPVRASWHGLLADYFKQTGPV